jgi:hypothetical protein
MTASALMVIGISKFFNGAWLTILLIPIFVYVFLRINQYYKGFDLQMSPLSIELRTEEENLMSLQRAAIPVSHINQGTVAAVFLARRVAKSVMGVHVELTEGDGKDLMDEWKSLWPDVPLYIIPSQYRSVTEPLISFLEETDRKYGGESTAVVLQSFVPAEWWQATLHNQRTRWIRQAIMNASRDSGVERIIIEVPYLLKL